MRDHSHYSTDDSEVCSHCGQPLHAPVPSYGRRGLSPAGLTVAVLLHLMLVAFYLFQPDQVRNKAQPAREGEVVYVAPLKEKPRAVPQEQAPKKTVRTPKKAAQPERVQVRRLPNTITMPDEKPVEVAKAEPAPAPTPAAEPEMDMSARIEARRKARGAASSEPPAEESADARGNRIALANIARANGRSNDEGATAEATILNLTFNSADLKVTVWNPYLRRHMARVLKVELGKAPDMETALIESMLEYVHASMRPDFKYTTRSGKVIEVSARREDAERLRDILYKDMFPEYRRR
ncbi:MAG TPA: hypothetical protein VF861_04690 [Telluria sp.]